MALPGPADLPAPALRPGTPGAAPTRLLVFGMSARVTGREGHSKVM